MITISKQVVYTDGSKSRVIYDIEVDDMAISDIDELTASKLAEQLISVIKS